MVACGEVWVSKHGEIGDVAECKGDTLGAYAGNMVLLVEVQSDWG